MPLPKAYRLRCSPTGEVQQFEMRDDVIKVEISKVEITTNKELPGAELIITNKDGKVVEHWTSTDKPHYIEKLPAGDYTLTEVKAPDGYAFAESVPFTVLPTGEVQQFEMWDDVIKVEISKVDITTNKELPGAELIITNKDGKVVEHWTSTDKPHYIEKLPAGDVRHPDRNHRPQRVRNRRGYFLYGAAERRCAARGYEGRPHPRTARPADTAEYPDPHAADSPDRKFSPLGLILALAGLSLAGLAALLYKCVNCKSVARKGRR